LSRFFGIVIKMFYDDHNPPHFHAEYGSDVALIDIRTLAVFSGRLPPRVTGLVIEWATLHQLPGVTSVGEIQVFAMDDQRDAGVQQY
jgi:hypothetical protein